MEIIRAARVLRAFSVRRFTNPSKPFRLIPVAGASFALTAIAAFGMTDAQAIAAVGAIAGSAGVNANGGATYSIPITLPPGTHNMQPSLSLTYDSQSGEGLAGYGWSLSGLSAIARCPATISSDGLTQAVQLNGPGNLSDDFCLDGQRLRGISGTYGADGATYGTEIEGFSLVTSHGSSTGPSYFTVQMKDGRIYEYGKTTDSKIYAQGTSVVRSWALDRVTDLNGNYMSYQYHQDTTDGDYWPTFINYTGNGSITPDHQVEFDYAARPNVIAGYIHGSLVTQTQLLTNIKVNYAGATTFNYTLGYQTANATGRSRLVSVTECGADGTCLPSTTIAWRTGQASGWASDTATPAAVTSAAAAAAAKLMDVDGDGVMDLVYPDNNPNSNTWKVMWGNPNGGFSSNIADTGISASTFFGIGSTLEMDYNGDGLTDLAEPVADNADGTGRGYQVLISQGTRTNPIFRTPGDNLPNLTVASTESGSAWAVDFHGSGSSDLVYSDGTHAYLYSNSDNFASRKTIYTAPSTAPTGHGSDLTVTTTSTYSDTPYNFDGSGRASALELDTVSYNVPCNPQDQLNCGQVQDPTNFYWDALISNETPGYTGYGSLLSSSVSPTPVDLNGDGLTDLLYTAPQKAGYTWRLALSTGAGFTTLTTSLGDATLTGGATNADPVIADYYGNGRQEAIVQTGSGTWAMLNVVYTAGSGYAINTVNLSNVLPSNYQGGTLRVGSIESDGLSDLVYAVSNSAGTSFTWHYRLHNGVAPDLVSSVTDGMGNFSQFQYASLADGAPTYTKGSSAQYPIQDIQPAMQVVSTLTQNDGVGGTYDVTYAYSGARVDPHGRGFLGFTTVTTTDSRNKNQEAVTYDQTFPWIGQVLNDVVSLKGGSGYFEIHGTNKNGPDYIQYGSGYSSRYMPYFDTTVSHDYDPASIATGVQGAQVRKTTSSLAASANNRSSTSFDNYGNTLDATLQVQDLTTNAIFTSETIADFGNDYDLDTYCVSMPQTVTVKKTAPSGASASRIANSNVDTSHCELAAGSNAASPSTTSTSDASGSPSLSTSYTYDSFGNVNQTVISGTGIGSTLATGGRTTSSTFTGNGEFSTTSNAQVGGGATMTSHDTWRYDFGAQASSTDPNGLITTTQYDGYGRSIKVIKPDGTATLRNYQWCSAAPVFPCPSGAGVYEVSTQQVANDGSTTINTGYGVYDAAGRIVEQGTVLLGGVVSKVDTTYDKYGQVVSVTEPYIGNAAQASTTSTYFNQVGKIKTVQAPSPQDPQAACYPNCQDVITYSYSGFSTTSSRQAGSASDLADGATQTLTTLTDALGRTVQNTDTKGGTTVFGFDASGNNVSTTDASGHVLTMSYDGLGHKTGMVDPNMGAWSYQVDALGEMLCQTDANGQSIIFSYDNVGRLSSKLETAAGAGCQATAGLSSTWTYDAPGALGLAASMSDSNGFSQTYDYDSLHRPADTVTTISGVPYTVSTTYDSFGRVATTSYPASVTPVAGAATLVAVATASPTPATVGTSVTLDGSGSSGSSNLQYQWTQTGGPTLSVGAFDSAGETTSFVPAIGGTYLFQLQVIDSSSAASTPVSVSVAVRAGAPGGLAVTGTNPSTSGTVHLQWTQVANVNSYNLYQSTDGVTFTQVQNVADDGSGTSTASVPNLANGIYYFAVASVANGVTGDQSPAVTAPVTLYPAAPAGMTDGGDADRNGTYNVSFNTVTLPAGISSVTYYLEEATGNSSGPTSSYGVAWSGTATTSPITVGISHPGNGSYYYYYRARAQDVNGYGPYSAVDSIHVVVRPGAPSSISVSPAISTTGDFTVSWGAASGKVTDYQVFKDTSSNFSSETFSCDTSARSCTASVSTTGKWYFRVRACNESDGMEVCSTGWASGASGTYTTGGGGGGGGGCPPPPFQCQLVLDDGIASTQLVAPELGDAALLRVEATATHPVNLDEVAAPALPSAESDTLLALASKRQELLGHEHLQPTESALQARVDRLRGIRSKTLALKHDDARGMPAFAPPIYQAYAGAAVKAVADTPYRFTVRYTYDPASGAMDAVSNADTGFIYWRAATDGGVAPVDAFGHIVGYVDGNNVSTVTAYDPATGVVSGISTGIGQSANVQQLVYTRDSFGNLEQRCDANKGLVENFTYDGLNRLKTSVVSNGLAAGSCTGGTAGAAIGMSYDAMGNVQTRSNTGLGQNDTYGYGDPSHPYAVTAVTGMPGTYQYDANGNMLSGNGRTVTWNDDNLPLTINSIGTVNGVNTVTGSSSFSYGPDLTRYQQVSTDSVVGNVSTVYVGGLFEIVTSATGVQYRHNIVAGRQTVAVHTIDQQSGTATTTYIHSDHLGSADTLTDDAGNVVQQMSFDAFGMRRDPTTWAYDLTPAQIALLKSNTDRGYTLQEQLDNVALIHMNGRLYDPTIDRMISADPTVEGAIASQAYNRYSYVYDNPLKYTDPSGYCGFCLSTFTNPVSVLTGIPMPASTAQNLLSGAADALKHPSVMFEDTSPIVGHYVNDAFARSSTLRQVGGYVALVASYWVGPEVYAGYEVYITDVQGGGVLQDLGAGVAGYMKAYAIDGAVGGGVSAFEANSWSGLGEYVIKTGAHDMVNRYFQREMSRFAAKNGMTMLQLDAELFAFSYIGDGLVGNRFEDADHGFGGACGLTGIGGFFDNEGGIISDDNVVLRYPLDFIFDSTDTLLAWQGLPDASSIALMSSGYTGHVYGESLGSLDVSNLQAYGVISSSTLYALPIGGVTPYGSTTHLEWDDPISLGPVSLFTNPEASFELGNGGVHLYSTFSKPMPGDGP